MSSPTHRRWDDDADDADDADPDLDAPASSPPHAFDPSMNDSNNDDDDEAFVETIDTASLGAKRKTPPSDAASVRANTNPDDGLFDDVPRVSARMHPIRDTTECRDVAYGTNCDGDREYWVGERTEALLAAKRADRTNFRALYPEHARSGDCDICKTLQTSRMALGEVHGNVSRILAQEVASRGGTFLEQSRAVMLRTMVDAYRRDVYTSSVRRTCKRLGIPMYEWTELKLRRHFEECARPRSAFLREEIAMYEDMRVQMRSQGTMYRVPVHSGAYVHVNLKMQDELHKIGDRLNRLYRELDDAVKNEQESILPLLNRQLAAAQTHTQQRVRVRNSSQQRRAMERHQRNAFNASSNI